MASEAPDLSLCGPYPITEAHSDAADAAAMVGVVRAAGGVGSEQSRYIEPRPIPLSPGRADTRFSPVMITRLPETPPSFTRRRAASGSGSLVYASSELSGSGSSVYASSELSESGSMVHASLDKLSGSGETWASRRKRASQPRSNRRVAEKW